MQVKSFFFWPIETCRFFKNLVDVDVVFGKGPYLLLPIHLCYCHHSNENYVAKHSYGAVDDTFTIISVKLLRPISFGDLQYLTGVTVWAGNRLLS